MEVLAAQGARYLASMLPIVRRRVRSKKAVGQGVGRLTAPGERCRLIKVIGRTRNGRQASVCAFVPSCPTPFETSPACGVNFDLYQLQLSARGIAPGPDCGTALVAGEHAIERLFLRLNTLDLGAVFDELHNAMLLALPVMLAGRTRGLRQMALPTAGGAFLCDLPPSGGCMVAKTWIADGALGRRWHPVVACVRDVVQGAGAGGERALAEFLALGVDGSLAEQPHALRRRLQDVFAGIPWLSEPYAPRPDPVGQHWTDARKAANAENIAGPAGNPQPG
jgi:hypothetical protein